MFDSNGIGFVDVQRVFESNFFEEFIAAQSSAVAHTQSVIWDAKELRPASEAVGIAIVSDDFSGL